MPGDIDPVSGKLTSQLEYDKWKYSETHSNIPGEPKYRYTTVWRERDVYVLEHGTKRKTYTQREQYGETKKQLTGTARKTAVARYEHKAAQKAVSLYEQAADPGLSLEERHVLARTAKYHADVGSDYLVEAKPGMPTTDKRVPVVDPRLLKEERHWRYYKEVPEHFKQRVTTPEDVKRLGLRERYLQESYAVSMGYKPEHVATQEWQETYEQAYYEKYPPAEPVVVKEKPKERSVWDISDWQKDFWGTAAGGVVDIFAPTSSRLMEDWIVGPLYKKVTGTEDITKGDIWRYNREVWRTRWKESDWGGAAIGVITSPLGLIGGTHLLGKGMGALSATKIGSKELFQIGIGEKVIGSAPAWTYKYTISVTPAKLAQAGITGYFGTKAVEGGIEAYGEGKLTGYLATIGLTIPMIIGPYKTGYYSGMKWVQRRGEMGTVTGIPRVRQKAGYDLIDQTYKLPQSQEYFGKVPYDIKGIKKIGTPGADIFYRMATGKGRMFWTGSGALKAQYQYFFRTRHKPLGTLESYAMLRQKTYPGQVGARPTLGYGPKGKAELIPKDIDIYFRSKSGMADYWNTILKETKIKGFDIHTYKAWQFPLIGKKLGIGGGYGRQYLELGIFQFKPVRTTALIRGVKGVSIVKGIPSISGKEQLLRMTRNLLPSKSELYGHRSYKDVSTWTDISNIIKPTAHTKWIDAYNRFISPELYPGKIPKVTFGEKIITKIGGPAKLVLKDGKSIYPSYSYLPPESYLPIPLAGAYSISPYKDVSYPSVKYITPSYPSISYPTVKPISYKYLVSTKAQIKPPIITPSPITKYETKKQPIPIYPISDTPSYITPSYLTPKLPAYTTPRYPEISYPTLPPIYPVTPSEKKKKLLSPPIDEREKQLIKVEPGYNVMVKSRQYYQGKPRGTTKFRMLTSKSFSHNVAMNLLGSSLDHSIAQTGYIKPSGKPAQKLHKSIPSRWDQIGYKFIRKKDKWIEDRAFAIDTKGETQELNVFRWYQRLPKKRKAVKRQTVVYSNKKEFDFGMKQFNKMLRRQRII